MRENERNRENETLDSIYKEGILVNLKKRGKNSPAFGSRPIKDPIERKPKT